MSKKLKELWDNLSTASNVFAVEFKALETGFQTPNGEKILIAIDSQYNYRHLIIPIKSGLYKDDTMSRGINVLYRVIVDGEIEFNFIDVVCKIPHLNELFDIIIDEIQEKIKLENSEPYNTCIKVLQQWRELLSKDYYRLLPESEIQGLFGELWYLRELTEFDVETIQYWQGPEGMPHDFSNGSLAFEVKTSQKKGRFATINGVDQLTAPPSGKLYLCIVKLQKVPGGGESVPNLIQSIRDKGVNFNELLTKLADVGYSLTDNEKYDQKYRYQIKENRVYLVDNNFPKITVDSFKVNQLPDKIIDIKYIIDLIAEPPIPISDADIAQMLQDMVR